MTKYLTVNYFPLLTDVVYIIYIYYVCLWSTELEQMVCFFNCNETDKCEEDDSGSKRTFNCRIYVLSNKYCFSKRFFSADNFQYPLE